jgi:hypothetical protein
VKHLPTVHPWRPTRSGPAADPNVECHSSWRKSRKVKVLETMNDWRGPSRHGHTLTNPFDPYERVIRHLRYTGSAVLFCPDPNLLHRA